MRGFSKAIITGNLTRDPELRNTPSGATVCSFSVAVNRVYKDSNGDQKEEVSFLDCTAWGRLGETIAQYAKRGTGVLVSGRLSQRSFEGKDGVKRSRVEIVVEDFNFVGGGGGRDGGASGGSSYGGASGGTGADAPEVPDEIPEGDIDLSEVPF
ncbi:single-stranded DNA-binding protein [Candidatus Saccharibacteria bacterium]|nr:single-stranded DNA-binding protein [Candidatus Saccharibacteria bacterium]